MSLYENIKCPVCNNEIQDGDDIVTCPECGTPHHRQCYDLAGKCVNSALHKIGYDFHEELKKSGEKPAYDKPPVFDDKAQDTLPFGEKLQTEPVFKDDGEKLFGQKISDIATVIKTNPYTFISKFKRIEKSKSAMSWNWGAFFFGPLYMLFRKMYKKGIALVALFMAGNFFFNTLLYKFAPQFSANITNLISSANTQRTSISPEQLLQALNTPDITVVKKIAYAFMIILFVARIIEGFVFDRLYKNQVVSIIKSVNEQLEENASFEIHMPMFIGETPELSQEQLRLLYLGKRGGVSLFAPIMAALIISFFI